MTQPKNSSDFECERRFLVSVLPEQIKNSRKENLIQFYMSDNPVNSSRIRLNTTTGKAYHTEKGPKTNGIGYEKEKEIPYNDATTLMQHRHGNLIQKDRYIFNQNGVTVELDVFLSPKSENENSLIIAEVEFSGETPEIAQTKMNNFVPFDWMGQEITEDTRYSNAALAFNGIPKL